MVSDVARLMNDLNTVTNIIVKDVDEVKLAHRLEEILSNYDISRRSELDVEDDSEEKLDMFLAAKQLEGLSQLTLEGYRMELSLFNKFTNKAVSTIKTHDIRSYLASNDSWAIGTVDKKLSVLKSFFGWLVQEEVTLRDPSRKVKSPKKPARTPRALSVEELEIVRESCVTLRERALVEVLYSTGCRLSEISELTLGDVDKRNMSAQVIGKGGKDRSVFFSFKAMFHLGKYLDARKAGREDDDHLFARMRRPFSKLSGKSIQREVSAIAERAGLNKKLTPHVFRHTFATLSMENGADLADVQQLLGHERPETTLVYAHVSESRKRQAHRRYHMQ